MAKTTRSTGATRRGSVDSTPDDVLLRAARIVIRDGSVEFAAGDGTVPDTKIARRATGGIAITGAASVSGAVVFSDAVDVTGTLTAFGYFGAGGNFGIGSGVSQGSFFGAAAVSKPEVTGHRDEPEGALKSLLTALASLGLITDSTDVT